MSRMGEATLADGRKIPYVITDNPPRGGMKYTYFAPDKSYVVQFFNEPNKIDRNMTARLEAIIGRYNPTIPESKGGAIGNDERLASYFAGRFCWPTDLVVLPEFGIVSPAYPKSFFFEEGASQFLDLKGKDKKSNWFTSSNRRFLNKSELGDFRSMIQMSLLLARSIRRLHQAGLAHSDLSNNNVLIDPKSGNCVVIDIDTLVVPGLFPPEVAGTRGYIAPEVLSTMELDRNDPRRMIPSSVTDLHALAVLIYEYLFFRHPLMGPKIYSTESAERDDYLGLGPMATFIEHPEDTSNRPSALKTTIKDLGPVMEKLFLRAFVDGLHNPALRPSAMEWERGLVKTWDLLHKCSNPSCEKKWFVLHDINNPVCPFCGTRITDKNIVRFELSSEVRGHDGEWRSYSELDVVNNTPLFKWHLYSNVFADEKADKSLQAYVCCHNGEWFLINRNAEGLLSPQGNPVPAGQAIRLTDGTVFRGSRHERGMLIKVRII
ncbi:MAG: hypothetical protein J6A05_03585 [Oscillospiraceae bacterium]|nr:hypothetical protein [Oscillospiraceae bacterium]